MLVFSDDFVTHAWYALLPFAVVAMIIVWVLRRVDGAAHDE